MTTSQPTSGDNVVVVSRPAAPPLETSPGADAGAWDALRELLDAQAQMQCLDDYLPGDKWRRLLAALFVARQLLDQHDNL